MTSINQTGSRIRLPNFCNLGVMLRVLVLVNLLALAGAAVQARGLDDLGPRFLTAVAYVEPVLVMVLALACAGRRVLDRLGYAASVAVIAAVAVGLAAAWARVLEDAFAAPLGADFVRLALLVLLATGASLAYLDLRSRALAPAIAEARIQALQARIRPHFLFNSINAALSLIRSEPKRAERALEDLADLFRVLMADERALQPMAREIDIARQYLAIEQLRLGDRLRVAWKLEAMPADALVPALIVQPLVENAVYHGIEPLEGGGEMEIEARRDGEQVAIRLSNPVKSGGEPHAGNRMALANIRERLQLHYDAEASMRTRHDGGRFEVHIRLPYVPAP